MAFVTKKITLQHNYPEGETKEYRRIVHAREQLDKDEKALIARLMNAPDLAMAAKLAGYQNRPEITLDYNGFTAVFSVKERIERDKLESPAPMPPAPETPKYINMDPKTLNSLLNSKLLTEEQKKELLRMSYPGMEQVLAKPEATQ